MDSIKRIAAINDLSGASRCSLTVALPVISALGIQCCVMPTAILSNHTGFESFYFEDYTRGMDKFSGEWEKLNLKFDCIYTGFLGSHKQIEAVLRFIDKFNTPLTKIVVDPVMGDNGEIYSTYSREMCDDMKLNTLEKLIDALRNEKNEVYIDETARIESLRPLERMLELAK